MRKMKKTWSLWILPLIIGVITLWYCEPGTSLNPGDKKVVSGKVPIITISATKTTLLPATDTVLVSVSIVDTSGKPLSGEPLTILSDRFSFLKTSANTAFVPPDTIPLGGSLAFRIFSNQTGTGRIIVTAGAGTTRRSDTLKLIVTEKPVPPQIVTDFPTNTTVVDSPVVTITVLDSAKGTPLENAEVQISSGFFKLFGISNSQMVASDTTGSDGKVSFRAHSGLAGTGSISVRVRTAAGIERTSTITISVTTIAVTDRPRKMTFVAQRAVLKADGSDSTQLIVVVKDDNNNPLAGEKIRFTATGGLVQAEAITDEWGKAIGMIISERVNKTVVITATLVKTGTTAQQIVVFDGITIRISTSRKVAMRDSLVNVLFELYDANGSPMSGDTLEITAVGAYKGFGQRLSSGTKDSLLIQVDTRGQYRTTITSQVSANVILKARALGAAVVDTTFFTNNSLSLTSNKGSMVGNGANLATISAKLVDGNNSALPNRKFRWTTTFGSFTSTPFTTTDANGNSSIILKAPWGSGLATVNVEAYDALGLSLVASGSVTVRITALPVKRISLKVTPDNIPVKVGEATLVAQAFDTTDNVMTNVLIGFKLVKGAGGGDEIISPPVAYTVAGSAQSNIHAGGVISFYRGVKITAVALDISGTDTLVIGSSDTVGLTISGPPHKISVGANILKGLNPNDGTFLLPTAAVVTDVNGNLVADGTPVNFGVIPVNAYHRFVSWTSGLSYGFFYKDTVEEELPWTDYNNNTKLDPEEFKSQYNPKNPYRGEDQDGNGIILEAPEPFDDLNGDGYWSNGTTGKASQFAEPSHWWSGRDSMNNYYSYFYYLDLNGNGVHDTVEAWTDVNGDGICQCTGQKSPNGDLYEQSYFGSPANRPYPGYSGVGIDRQASTVSGKATTRILYVQTDATYIKVRVTAEANGIRNSTDVRLPIILGK